MTIEEIKKICQENHSDKSKPFKDGCQKCEYWKSTRGCNFYNRPCDWLVKENNK